MKKIAMRVTVLVASLALSGAAFAGTEAPKTESAAPVVAPVADAKVTPTTGKEGSGRLMAAAPTDGKEQKVVKAVDAKGAAEQKGGEGANKQKPETTAKGDAKAGTPAPVAVQESSTRK
ncbi:MAG: hypothetical protein HQL88_06700 [Magnetococcales bacterium]|nr:hypothetical protein [Magnetococcales bacterium]